MKILRPLNALIVLQFLFSLLCSSLTEAADDLPRVAQLATDQSLVNQAAAKKLTWKVGQPSPDDLSMLRRFVEECVSISPGKLRIPRGPSDSELAADLVITEAYRISRFEMTQELYQLVMGVNPSRWRGPRNSVEQVTYSDAVQFCEKLTRMLRSHKLIAPDQMVRLPTDVEWEFACRAGAKTKYCFGNLSGKTDGRSKLDEYAWHAGNAAGNDPSVGVLKANRWHLADVHGYLWEFTRAAKSARSGGDAEVRIWGGSWTSQPENCGCSSTRKVSTADKAPDLGFRCVISRKVAVKNTDRQ